LPNPVSDYGFLLQVIKPDALVLCYQDPAFFAYEGQPCCILRSGGKVLAVTFVPDAVVQKGIQDWFAVVKVLVEKEN